MAKITLNDCLACSGCITSAESILIDQQDYHEAQRVLQLNQSLDPNVYSSRFFIQSTLFLIRIQIRKPLSSPFHPKVSRHLLLNIDSMD